MRTSGVAMARLIQEMKPSRKLSGVGSAKGPGMFWYQIVLASCEFCRPRLPKRALEAQGG